MLDTLALEVISTPHASASSKPRSAPDAIRFWTLLASVAFVAAGVFLLLFRLPIPALAVIVYGAGNGLNSIARGSMPLALFGPSRYAIWMGKLATPTLIAGAAAPYASSLAVEAFGSTTTVAILTAVAAANVCASLALATKVLSRSKRSHA